MCFPWFFCPLCLMRRCSYTLFLPRFLRLHPSFARPTSVSLSLSLRSARPAAPLDRSGQPRSDSRAPPNRKPATHIRQASGGRSQGHRLRYVRTIRRRRASKRAGSRKRRRQPQSPVRERGEKADAGSNSAQAHRGRRSIAESQDGPRQGPHGSSTVRRARQAEPRLKHRKASPAKRATEGTRKAPARATTPARRRERAKREAK